MIVGVGVREYGLRMRRLQHFLQVGIEETWRQAVPLRELCCELVIGFGNSDDLQVRPLLKLVEESERVSVHQSRQYDTHRRVFSFFSRPSLSARDTVSPPQ